jgi:hypothetical protein
MSHKRKSRDEAMALRGAIAMLLAGRSQLEPSITDKELARLLGNIPLITTKRHRAWVRQAHAAGRLHVLLK